MYSLAEGFIVQNEFHENPSDSSGGTLLWTEVSIKV